MHCYSKYSFVWMCEKIVPCLDVANLHYVKNSIHVFIIIFCAWWKENSVVLLCFESIYDCWVYSIFWVAVGFFYNWGESELTVMDILTAIVIYVLAAVVIYLIERKWTNDPISREISRQEVVIAACVVMITFILSNISFLRRIHHFLEVVFLICST